MSDASTRSAAPGAVLWKDSTSEHRLATAQSFLSGQEGSFSDLCSLAYALKDADKRFSHARRLLLRAYRHPDHKNQPVKERRRLLQQLALCTYKDDDLPAERRFDRALDWLRAIAPLDELADPESLCLAGAIYKRQWEATRHVSCLRQSLAFYSRGNEVVRPETRDYDGYGAINAAFVSDLLAAEEAKTKISSGAQAALALQKSSTALRQEIVDRLAGKVATADPASAWWLYVTLAEARLGLLDCAGAEAALTSALKLSGVYPWQLESTARQLSWLAHLLAQRDPFQAEQLYRVIETGFGLSAEARDAIVLGRFGVALSGGGFRASLFHIGFLARLAELDLLRHVEVLSCVSGGSIIGTYYYLELRTAMLDRSDADMEQGVYLEIMKRVEERFLAGVQTNIRASIPTDLWADLRMLCDPRYSRTTRIGDLYQSRLFDEVLEPESQTAGRVRRAGRPRWLSDLPFVPKDAPAGFNPKLHNWTRSAKVPMLVINATTLNTGHNWQFTGTWMGEAASTIDSRIDSNDYLRRMYYDEAPEPYRTFGVPIGHAVAASSCVPGLFPALKLAGLYEKHPVIRLVDGGVHDNQGIAALLDQDCSVLFVSDASGQLRSGTNPPGGVIGGPTRANLVLQARVRLAQYRELAARKQSGALRELTWIHLREGLEAEAVNWNGCREPFSREDEALPPTQSGPLLGFGIDRALQDALACIRTDLDSFSATEAHALMLSAYQMTKAALAREDSPFHARTETPGEWDFLAVTPHMKAAASCDSPVARALRAGQQVSFKAWRVSPLLSIASSVLMAIVGSGLLYLVLSGLSGSPIGHALTADARGPFRLTVAIVLLAIGIAVLRWALRTYGRFGELFERGTFGLLTALLWLPMKVHLVTFDKIFLRSGRYWKK